MRNIEKLTDLDSVKLNLKFATDDELSIGTRSFYKNEMAKVMAAVDAELTSVLGDHWTTLKA